VSYSALKQSIATFQHRATKDVYKLVVEGVVTKDKAQADAANVQSCSAAMAHRPIPQVASNNQGLP
jgi:hypothetical protein